MTEDHWPCGSHSCAERQCPVSRGDVVGAEHALSGPRICGRRSLRATSLSEIIWGHTSDGADWDCQLHEMGSDINLSTTGSHTAVYVQAVARHCVLERPRHEKQSSSKLRGYSLAPSAYWSFPSRGFAFDFAAAARVRWQFCGHQPGSAGCADPLATRVAAVYAAFWLGGVFWLRHSPSGQN